MTTSTVSAITTTIPAIAPVASKVSKGKGKDKASTASTATATLSYCMMQGYRPGSGSALFAHTAAALALLGMDKGKRIPRSTLTRILGETAVKHHTNSTGFFEQDSNGVAVSSMGRDAFAMRSINPELLAGFMDILTTGKTSRALPTSFTNPLGIKAL